jgi:hypothetical protein
MGANYGKTRLAWPCAMTVHAFAMNGCTPPEHECPDPWALWCEGGKVVECFEADPHTGSPNEIIVREDCAALGQVCNMQGGDPSCVFDHVTCVTTGPVCVTPPDTAERREPWTAFCEQGGAHPVTGRRCDDNAGGPHCVVGVESADCMEVDETCTSGVDEVWCQGDDPLECVDSAWSAARLPSNPCK